ncbi:MAG: hypothetical protein IJ021_02400 [Clostridia bacterium]|nr:hypothetical protein [Clostridia bacterium]
MSKTKTVITWVLFTFCLVLSFTFGYFIRGIAEAPTQTADTMQTTAAAQTTTASQTTATAQTTTASQTTTMTPTSKPVQTTTAMQTTAHTTSLQTTAPVTLTYILNTSSKKIHYPHCSSAKKIAEKNKGEFTGDYQELFSQGYTTCGICFK